LGGCANRFWQADSRMPNKDRHPVHDAGYFSRNLRLARAENQSDLTPSRQAAKKTQRNPNDLFHSSNLIAGYPRFKLFSSLRLCGFAALREIFSLRHQLLRGETVGDASDTIADHRRGHLVFFQQQTPPLL
jgi:hypothetical protein